jgi:hypothetical protein
VRHYHGWYRHSTLAMLALATWRWYGPGCQGQRSKGAALAELAAHGELIELLLLTGPEVRWLVYRLVVRSLAPSEAVLHWSCWRRQHQAHATGANYRSRLA